MAYNFYALTHASKHKLRTPRDSGFRKRSPEIVHMSALHRSSPLSKVITRPNRLNRNDSIVLRVNALLVVYIDWMSLVNCFSPWDRLDAKRLAFRKTQPSTDAPKHMLLSRVPDSSPRTIVEA